ncbi:MAG: transcriptional repressor [bacterium]|nr:transcriptional repressor [bacterium]
MAANKPQRRNSPQREKIFQIIAESRDHPTALNIYEQLRKAAPPASLGNVYRNIAIIQEEGRIASRDVGDGVVHYDAVTGDHCHFVCEHCGSVSDFDMPLHREITEEARRKSSHDIRGHTIQFHGVCRKCIPPSKTAGGGKRK